MDKGELAAHSLWRGGYASEVPLDVEALCGRLGVMVRTGHSSSIDAAISLYPGGAVLSLNMNTPPRRRRFAAAHELGHMFLRHAPIREGTYRPLWQEREADAFASALLMPAWAFYGLDLDTDRDALILGLCRQFQVSRKAICIRLTRLFCTPAIE